ncbi:autotransporter outer membrane beta-barrel domain-containing protein [Candidatus Pelagibacter ubique]|nr:autotransporter outer membrane beta-barrel domain-containing protein [Candidatus Pelagibacter ubique]
MPTTKIFFYILILTLFSKSALTADYTSTQNTTNGQTYSNSEGDTIQISITTVDDYGIENLSGNTIHSFSNRADITLSGNNTGNIKGILNSGTITGNLNQYGDIDVTTSGSMDSDGSRSGNVYGFQNRNSLTRIIHRGNITSTSTGKGTARGIDNSNGGDIDYLTINTGASVTVVGAESSGGSQYGTYNATGIYNHADTSSNNQTIIGLFQNGTITATRTGIQNNAEAADATITTLSNSGTIKTTGITSVSETGSDFSAAIHNTGTENGDALITTLTNSSTGVIQATANGGYGVLNSTNSTITTFTNEGSIIGGTTSGYGIRTGGVLTTLTNKGTIDGKTHDIQNISALSPTFTNLVNQQGADGNDILTFDGTLPTNYKVIVASTTDYGKVLFSNEAGVTNFTIDSSSSVSNNTKYAAVVDGIGTSSLGSTRSGSFGEYTWEIVLQSGSSDTWDLIIGSIRTAYTARITVTSLSKIAEVLEAINTEGSNSTLTSALDGLSDASLDKALNQIEGVTIKSVNGQSFKKHSTFKRAVSSALSGPSVNSLTKNNYASLSLNDLSLPSDQGGYQVHSFNNFDFKSMASIFKNKDLFSLKSKGSTFFIRTFADQSNQDVVNGDAGYEESTAGFLVGNENNLSDKIQQGWALGLSASDTDFDDNFGNSDSKTLHAMIYQNQQYDNFNLGLNIGTYVTRADMNREITEGTIQTLKSKTYNYGFDITADIKQSYTLKNDFIFTPSFSTNISYILQDDLDESGGDLALSVNNDNLLIVKPEIGFALDKNLKNTETVSQNFGFSVYGSYEDKLEGTTSKAKIKDTGSNFDIVDDNTDDTFITAGLGFTSTDKEKNKEYNFGIYHTQNDDNDLNSTLLSYNFKQKF